MWNLSWVSLHEHAVGQLLHRGLAVVVLFPQATDLRHSTPVVLANGLFEALATGADCALRTLTLVHNFNDLLLYSRIWFGLVQPFASLLHNRLFTLQSVSVGT